MDRRYIAMKVIRSISRKYGIDRPLIELTDKNNSSLICGDFLMTNSLIDYCANPEEIKKMSDNYYKRLNDGCENCQVATNCPLCIYNE